MMSVGAMLLKLQLSLLKPVSRFTTIEAARAGQDALGKIGAGILDKLLVTYEDVPFEQFEACFAIPDDCETAETRAILYLHGGGYTAGGLDYAKGFGGILAANSAVKTLCVAYRLAPENKFPAALDDAVTAYRYLLERYAPEQIAFAGESAGGGLCYCLLHRCREEGLPLPRCVVAISPWADLTLSGKSYQNNVRRDPSLCRESLAYYLLSYAAGKETDPCVSPIFGEFNGFPPSRLYAGGSEILLDDSRTLCARLTDAGCDARLHIEPGMWHVYPLYGTPEGRVAIKDMSEFIQQMLGVTAPEQPLLRSNRVQRLAAKEGA